ncbi:MAG: DUF4332 domain-containing protein [Euryarchaeota archaeon]|nr:DUF4332 domain-containing protein [Euryarchaeota archaeon]
MSDPSERARAESSDHPFERAVVRPGRGLEADLEGRIDGIVDRVLADHEAFVATLERDVRIPVSGIPEGPASVLRGQQAALDALRSDVDVSRHRAELEAERRMRARLVEDLRPSSGPVFREDPIVTREGVLRVDADFAQAAGLGPVVESRLYAHGVRTASAYLDLDADELVRVTGLGRDVVVAARDDLRLERIAGLPARAADLLRVAGVHSVSRLAASDPAVLSERIVEMRNRHRLARLPDAIASEAAVARLVEDAKALVGRHA